MVGVGDTAPEFTLQGVDGWRIEPFTLSDYTDDGQFVVLVFYVYDFSPVCTTQLCELDGLDAFVIEDDVALLGIAPDGPFAHKEFVDRHDISYPLLCDTAEEVAEAYDVLYDEKDGLDRVPKRSMFLVDHDRRVQIRWVADDNWDEWSMEPSREIKDRIDELRAAD